MHTEDVVIFGMWWRDGHLCIIKARDSSAFAQKKRFPGKIIWAFVFAEGVLTIGLCIWASVLVPRLPESLPSCWSSFLLCLPFLQNASKVQVWTFNTIQREWKKRDLILIVYNPQVRLAWLGDLESQTIKSHNHVLETIQISSADVPNRLSRSVLFEQQCIC